MHILAVEPRSAEWHAIRNDSWTASMAAVLVAKDNALLLKEFAASRGVQLDIEPLLDVGIANFFDHTLGSLWASKNGLIPRFAGNKATERGVENEEFVIHEFEKSEMLICTRDITAQAADDRWLLASFDAVVPADFDVSVHAPFGIPMEAKCPAFPSRKKLWDSRKATGVAVMGLPYYWCQVQHQILVAEAPYGWFCAIGAELNPETDEVTASYPIMEKVARDDRFLAAYKAAAKFYYDNFIYNFDEPPRLPVDERLLKDLAEKAELDKVLADGNHGAAIDMYLNAIKEHEAWAAKKKDIESKLISAAKSMRAEGSNVVTLANRLSIVYGKSSTTSWQKAAKVLAKRLGSTQVPEDVLTLCKGPEKEVVKLKEI